LPTRKSIWSDAMTLPSHALLLTLMLMPGVARPACECFCVDGALQTLCTDLADAADRVDRCAGRSAERCPVNLEFGERRQYAAPVEGSTNCRDVSVYDPASDEHRAIKVCDVAPDASP
jgi:hypothetical protein